MKKTKLRLVKLDGWQKRKWADIRKDGCIEAVYENFFYAVLGYLNPALTVLYVGTKVEQKKTPQ